MCIDQKSRKDSSATPKLRIEPVDNWHTHWQTVLSSIDSAGHRSSLLVDDDGWLSARQVLLVAFHEVDVAGHICFRVLPIADDAGQVIVQAHLDAVGVKPGFESLEIGPALRQAAEHRGAGAQMHTIYWLLNPPSDKMRGKETCHAFMARRNQAGFALNLGCHEHFQRTVAGDV